MLDDIVLSLLAVNNAMKLFSSEFSASEADAALLTVNEHAYKVMGAATDSLLLTFTIAMSISMVEWHTLGLMQQVAAPGLLWACFGVVTTTSLMLSVMV